jgi:hypothetical protein
VAILKKRNYAELLDRAHEDLAACEQAVADLRAEREQSLADGTIDVIARLDLSIIDRQRQVQVYLDKIPLLQARLADELAEQRKADREKAIKTAETVLPLRMSAIYDLGRWATQGVALVEKLEAASRLPGWPAGLERPYASDLDNTRFLSALGRALSGLGEKWNPQRALDVIGDACEIENEHHTAALDDLKLNPATGTAVESEAA